MIKSISLILLLFSISLSQGPDTLWTRTYGGDKDDGAYSIRPTSDGGYIVVGYTRSFGNGGSDIWLLKLDASGDTLWTKTFGSTYDDEGWDVQPTSDGGYILTGFMDSMPNWGKLSLIKTDENGNMIWIKQYRAPDGPAEGYSISETSDHGFIVTGMVGHSAPSASEYIWLLKTDTGGDTTWGREWGYPECFSLGTDVHETSDGGYILTGALVLPSTHYRKSIGLIKTSSSGGDIWTRTYGDSTGDDYGYSVCECPSGGYIVVGVRRNGGYILRIDANGDSLWARSFGGNEYRSVTVTADTGYAVVGSKDNDIYLIRIDENGDPLWTSRYGGSDADGGYAVEQTADSGYIIAGYTYSSGAGSSDVYLVKTEPEPGIGEALDNSIGGRYRSTIITGSISLPNGRRCRIFDSSGREVKPESIRPGIYFIQVDGRIEQKVIKVIATQ